MRKGVPVLAYGERHPSARKDSPKSGQEVRQVVGRCKLVSIYTRAGVGGSSLEFVARLEIWQNLE